MSNSAYGVVVPAPVLTAEQCKAEDARRRREIADSRKAALNKPLGQNLGGFLRDALKGKKLRGAR